MFGGTDSKNYLEGSIKLNNQKTLDAFNILPSLNLNLKLCKIET
jgi:hypothetical protein